MTINQGPAGAPGSCGTGYPLGNWRTFGTATLVGGTLTVGDNIGYDPGDSDGDCNFEGYLYSTGTADVDVAVYSQTYTQPISFSWSGCIGSTAYSYMFAGLGFADSAFTGAQGSSHLPVGAPDITFMTRWEFPGQLFVFGSEGAAASGVQVVSATQSAGGMCGAFEVRSGSSQVSAYFNGSLVYQGASTSNVARVPYFRSWDVPITATNPVVATIPTPVNGSCGAANGGVFSTAPTANLCAVGTPSAVSSNAPWTWICAGSNGGANDSCTAQLADTVPDAFSFVTQTNAALNAVLNSNAVTITGANSSTPITVSGGTYSIGCTATFTSVAGTISNNQTVCVRHISSATNGATVTTILTIGGVAGTFSSTTIAAPVVPGVCAIQPTPGKDTFYGTTYQTQGQPMWDVMFTGGWGDSYSSLVEIDVSALPSAAATQSATLWLYVAAKGVNDPALQIFRITSPWTATGVTSTNVPARTLLGAAPAGVLQGSWFKIDIDRKSVV